MDQLKKIFASLSMGQRLMILAMALAVAGGVYGLAHWKKESDFKAMYKGLAPEDSAAVVAKLKESGVDFRLTDSGDSVLVPSAKLAEMRLEMAAAGLPKTGRIGFEIFDKANLGATEFVEHVNYRRALEGELERSVAALSEVEQARVHLTFPKESVFLESREPAKASVLVKLRAGAHLSPRNVAAVSQLIASAVEGLLPDAVSVLDMQGNLLSRPMRSADERESDEALEYRQKVEHDLVQKINATLDPLLGQDRYRSNVSAECDITSGEQSEETVDPAHSVMLTSQKSEDSVTGPGSTGVPGTASNLPRPAARPGSTGSSTSRRTENITYQSSRVVRKTKLPQGSIKRISVAVLLDQTVSWQGVGSAARRVVTPPSPETVKTVRDLVSTVVGLSQPRGDQIMVDTLPFDATLRQPAPEGPAVAPKPTDNTPQWNKLLHDPKMLLPVAGGAVLLLILAGAAIFFLRKKSKNAKSHGVGMAKGLPGGQGVPAIAGPTVEQQIEAKMAEQIDAQKKSDEAMLASFKVPVVKTKKAEVLVKQLREGAKNDAAVSAQVIQTWLHER